MYYLHIITYFISYLKPYIAVRNGTGNPNSNPGQSCLHFSLCYCLWKKNKSICSPLSYGEIIRQTEFFSLGWTTSLREGKLWIQTSFALLKNWLCVTSSRWWNGWGNHKNWLGKIRLTSTLNDSTRVKPTETKI